MRQRSGVQRKPLMQMVLHSYTIRTTTSCTPMPGGSPTPSSRRAGMAPPYRECAASASDVARDCNAVTPDCVISPLLSRAATSIYSTTCILCSCQMTRGRATTGSLPRTAWTEPRRRTTRRQLRGRLRGATAMGGLVGSGGAAKRAAASIATDTGAPAAALVAALVDCGRRVLATNKGASGWNSTEASLAHTRSPNHHRHQWRTVPGTRRSACTVRGRPAAARSLSD